MEKSAEKRDEERTVLPYKFLDRDLHVGDVRDFIGYDGGTASAEASRDTLVVGIDFGHGECMAYKRYRLGSGWITVPLYFDDANSKKLMTVIRYGEDGTVTIGKEVSNRSAAARGGAIFPYFKVPPSQWEDLTGLRDGSGSDITFGRVIRDFLGELWNRILQYDQIDSTRPIREAKNGGHLLVAMGCPASSDWTGKESAEKLRDLLRDITGCERVSVMPEPKAALMAPIVYAKNVSEVWKTRLTDLMTEGSGICIYDLGSSTIDFTYVRMGRILITRSIRVGGSDLDRGMLRRAESLTGKCFGCGWGNQGIRDENTLSLREAKEKYYDGADPSVSLKALEKAGGRVAVRDVYVKIDSAFIEGVVGRGGDGNSWYWRVREFFDSTRRDVATHLGMNADSFNGLIILTGGTSHVTEVREICAGIWDAVEENPFEGDAFAVNTKRASFTVLKDPSGSVAAGLTFAKSTECEAAAGFSAMRAQLEPSYNSAYSSFLDGFSAHTASVALKELRQTVNDLSDGKPHRTLDVVSGTMSLIQKKGCYSGENMRRTMDNLLGVDAPESKLAACQQDIIGKVNALSGSIYGGQLSGGIVLSGLKISGDVGYFLSGSVANALTRSAITAALKSTFTALSLADALMSAIRAVLPFKMPQTERPTFTRRKWEGSLSPEEINEIKHKLDTEETVKSVRSSVCKCARALMEKMDPADLKEPFFRMLDDQLEVALGKILFLVYDTSSCG